MTVEQRKVLKSRVHTGRIYTVGLIPTTALSYIANQNFKSPSNRITDTWQLQIPSPEGPQGSPSVRSSFALRGSTASSSGLGLRRDVPRGEQVLPS